MVVKKVGVTVWPGIAAGTGADEGEPIHAVAARNRG